MNNGRIMKDGVKGWENKTRLKHMDLVPFKITKRVDKCSYLLSFFLSSFILLLKTLFKCLTERTSSQVKAHHWLCFCCCLFSLYLTKQNLPTQVKAHHWLCFCSTPDLWTWRGPTTTTTWAPCLKCSSRLRRPARRSGEFFSTTKMATCRPGDCPTRGPNTSMMCVLNFLSLFLSIFLSFFLFFYRKCHRDDKPKIIRKFESVPKLTLIGLSESLGMWFCKVRA